MNVLLKKIQIHASLQFALYGGLLFFVIQVALSRLTPEFYGHRAYSFWLLCLIGLSAGCAGWGCGIALSPIGNQVSGAQKILAAIAVFWTGVVAGHLPKLASAVSLFGKESLSQSTKIEMLFGLGTFLFSTCVTFNTRIDA